MSKNKKTTKNQPQLKKEVHTLEKALDMVLQNNKAKFDSSVEVHLNLGIDVRKGDQQIRGAVSLPHGTGKTVRIAAFVLPENIEACKQAGADFAGGEEMIAEIKKSEKTEFDVAVAEPGIMKNLAQIAKILGTRGLMPSPKNETVTGNPAKAIGELKKGKISFKNDNTGNLHVIIGKVSFSKEKLLENYNTLLETIKKSKPASSKGTFIKNVSICSTMGKGYRVSL